MKTPDFRPILSMTAITFLTVIAAFMLSSCSAYRPLSYSEMKEEYDPNADGYNYMEEMDDYYYDYMGY